MAPPRRLRVLAIGNVYPPHDFGGGYELTWRSAMAHLRASGHTVRILASVYRSPDLAGHAEVDPDVHRELALYWEDHGFPRRTLRERVAIERTSRTVVREHLRAFQPDVVNWWGLGGLSLSLLEHVRRAGVPAVGVVGDEWMLWGPRADAWTRAFASRPRLAAVVGAVSGLPAGRLGGGERWLFNSDSVRRKMRRSATAFALDRADVLHPGIDDELFTEAPAQEWRWRLLYLGRLDPRKGLAVLVEALALLPGQATLVLQGSGEPAYVAELRELVARLGLDDRVAFSTAPRDELPGIYADADAVVFPVQWEEPWGLVPLEAMAVGRPVVATGTGGSAEYLRDGENCLLYRPKEDPGALAAALRRLGEDPDLRARLRRGGLDTAPRYTEGGYNEGIRQALEEEGAPGLRCTT